MAKKKLKYFGATKTSLSTCGHDLIFFRKEEKERKNFGAKDIEKWTIVNQDSKRLNLSLNAWTQIEGLVKQGLYTFRAKRYVGMCKSYS